MLPAPIFEVARLGYLLGPWDGPTSGGRCAASEQLVRLGLAWRLPGGVALRYALSREGCSLVEEQLSREPGPDPALGASEGYRLAA